MSSENEPVTANVVNDSAVAPDPTPQPPVIEPPSAAAGPAQSTSEANPAAPDPNADAPVTSVPSEVQPPMPETDLDVKAAESSEEAASGAAVVAPETSEDIGTTPSSSKKNNNSKRRPSGVVPEHKSKKMNRKKSMPVLYLDAKPGDYYFARLRGHPSWPAIICDEDMLPESLLASRPVTAARPDGSYREDFQEGGKNVKDRTYPVMFLFTNEFAWLPNIDLSPLHVETIKDEPQGKKSKKLYEAYKVAVEEHDLEHFKTLLSEFELERQKLEAEVEKEIAEQEAKAAEKAADKAAKKDSKPKRKSKGGDADDVDMEDVGPAPKSVSKKRKKSTAVDELDDTKPVKTPKTSLKVSLSRASNGESSAKAKPKSAPKAAISQEPQLSEEENFKLKQKNVMYLRHKLQKGLLGSSAPVESEMPTMAAHFDALEQYQTLEVVVLKHTKIHKVLKTILKLDSVPMDGVYNFKDRALKLLQGWNKILADGSESVALAAKDTDTNGVGSDDKANGDAGEDSKSEGKADEPTIDATKVDEGPETSVETKAGAAEVQAVLPFVAAPLPEDEASTETTPTETKVEEIADVSMTDAPALVEDTPAEVVTTTLVEPTTATETA